MKINQQTNLQMTHTTIAILLDNIQIAIQIITIKTTIIKKNNEYSLLT